MSGAAPIITVWDDQTTYEKFEAEVRKYSLQRDISENRPQGPLDRLLTDTLALSVIYGCTFIVCDALRSLVTGDWTSLIWMLLGPWDYLTGMPILSHVAEMLGWDDSYSPAVNRCHKKFETAQKECFAGSIANPLAYGDCIQAALDQETSCIQGTDEYAECVVTQQAYIDQIESNPLVGTSSTLSAEQHCLNDLVIGQNA